MMDADIEFGRKRAASVTSLICPLSIVSIAELSLRFAQAAFISPGYPQKLQDQRVIHGEKVSEHILKESSTFL